MAKELVVTPAIMINRSAWPPNAEGKPRLVVFSDGSSVAYAAVVYVIFRVPKDVASPPYLSLPKDVASSLHSTLPKDMASPGLESESSYEACLLLLKAKIPDEEVVKTIQEPAIMVCHHKVSNKSVCSCKVCSLLSDPCDCSACGKAIKPSNSSHF